MPFRSRGVAAVAIALLPTLLLPGTATAARRKRRPASPPPPFVLLIPITERAAVVGSPSGPISLPAPVIVPDLEPASEPPATPVPEAPLPEPTSPEPLTPEPPAENFPSFIFPLAGQASWTDTFNPGGGHGRRRHHGQDLMAPKMTPLVAVFDGIVTLRPPRYAGGHYMLFLQGDNGLQARYMHINNDTPGTDDGMGGDSYAYAPGLLDGDRVAAGQHIAWVGDSGNAEGTAPHLHFELWGGGGCLNPASALRTSQQLIEPRPVLAPMAASLAPGECRWDGIVHSWQADSGVAIINLTAAALPTGQVLSVPRRRMVWVRIGETALQDRSGGRVSRETLRPGLRLSVLGHDPGNGKAVQGRVVAVTPDAGGPRMADTAAVR